MNRQYVKISINVHNQVIDLGNQTIHRAIELEIGISKSNKSIYLKYLSRLDSHMIFCAQDKLSRRLDRHAFSESHPNYVSANC